MKIWKKIYCIVFFAAALIPLLGMAAGKNGGSAEKRRLAEFPAAVTEGKLNKDYLSQLGDYFQDHFGFRDEMITANSLIRSRALLTSTVDTVIQGTDGWLYYRDSLPDYQGTELLSDRSIFNLAHTIRMTREILFGRGIRFVFAAAPNKNSLYPENMPYYDAMVIDRSRNLIRLQEKLKEMGVPYADLDAALRGRDEVLYHARDSHWNNMGAAIAADLIMQAAALDHTDFSREKYQVTKDFSGDMDQMVYPAAVTPEEEIRFEPGPSFDNQSEIEDYFAPRVETVKEGHPGSLLMFRDSFANALIPFLSDGFGHALYSRGIPYQMNFIEQTGADCVIIERAERFLPETAQNPPVLETPLLFFETEPVKDSKEELLDAEIFRQGLLYGIKGRIPEGKLETEDRIYIRINGKTVHEAFPTDLKTEDAVYDTGFCLYVPETELDLTQGNNVEVIIFSRNELYVAQEGSLTWEEEER